MIIDDLPSISIANDSDEIAIEQGTATKKITKGNFLQEVTSAISSLLSSLSGKVSKAGDTMTGTLNLNNSNIDINTTPSGTAWGNAYYTLRDKNDNDIGRFRALKYSDGRCGVQILGRNGSAENSLRLLAKQDGTRQVLINDSAAWRYALGLTYAANNTFSVTEAVIGGLVTNNASRLLFDVNVDKSLENISTVTVTAMTGYTAGVNGVIDSNSSASTNLLTKSGYSISATKLSDYTVRIMINKSSAFTNATTATPFTYYGTFTLKFT